jgi:hypothetical protein
VANTWCEVPTDYTAGVYPVGFSQVRKKKKKWGKHITPPVCPRGVFAGKEKRGKTKNKLHRRGHIKTL